MGDMSDIKQATETVELWLHNDRSEVTCTLVHQDESADPLDVDAFTLKGAMREMTAWMITEGWTPIGRWKTGLHDEFNNLGEASRSFRR